jgi:hypothetical protein
MPTIKTLICEVREDGDYQHDDGLFKGAVYRVLYDDDQIIENTITPVLATAEALSARGHTPDTLFALRDWQGTVRCVMPIEHAMA